MRTLQNMQRLAVIMVSALLSGCSGEPGEPDIRDALARNQQTMMGLTMLFAGPRGDSNAEAKAKSFIREAAIKVDGCVAAQNAPGFVCDFRMGQPGGQQMGPPMKARFFKSGNGWDLEQTR